MNETAQIVIVGVITVLTIILTLVGIHIVLVLQELRKTLTNANSVLGDVRNLSTKLTHSTESMSGLFTGVKTALSLIGQLRKNND